MKSFSHTLLAAGHAIIDDELISYILSGLDLEFESLVVHLTPKDSVSLQEVQ